MVVRLHHLYWHLHLQLDHVAWRPAPPEWQILPCPYSGHGLAVYRDMSTISPAGDTQVKSEFRCLRRRDFDLHLSVPRIACLLCDLEPGADFQMPIQFRIVVQMNIERKSTRL